MTEKQAAQLSAKALNDSSAFYDQCSYFYNKWQADFYTGEDILHFLQAQFQACKLDLQAELQNAACLDIGCGTGNFVKALRAAEFQAYGIDNSVAMIVRAQQGGAAYFAALDCTAANFPAAVDSLFPAKQWKLLTALTDVCNHFDSSHLTSLFSNVSSLLKEGGFFFCDFLMAENFWQRALYQEESFDDGENFARWQYKLSLATANEAACRRLDTYLERLAVDPDNMSETVEELSVWLQSARLQLQLENALLTFVKVPNSDAVEETTGNGELNETAYWLRRESSFKEYLHNLETIKQLAANYNLTLVSQYEALEGESQAPWQDGRLLFLWQKNSV